MEGLSNTLFSESNTAILGHAPKLLSYSVIIVIKLIIKEDEIHPINGY